MDRNQYKGYYYYGGTYTIIDNIQSILNGFEHTDQLKLKLLRTYNASKIDTLLYLVIPSNKSTIAIHLKLIFKYV